MICTWFLKNHFGKIKFDDLEFWSISNWIFTPSAACKNQFWNWFLQATQAIKIKFKIDKKSSLSNLIFQTWFFRNQVQINRGSIWWKPVKGHKKTCSNPIIFYIPTRIQNWRIQEFNDILMFPSTKRIDENVKCWMEN